MPEIQPGLGAPHDWAKRVHNYCEKHRLSVPEFGRKAKVSAATVYGLLNGSREVSREVATRVERVVTGGSCDDLPPLKRSRLKPAKAAKAPSGGDVLPLIMLIAKCGASSCSGRQFTDLVSAYLALNKLGIRMTVQQVGDKLKKG